MNHTWTTTPDGYHCLHVKLPDGRTVRGPCYATPHVDVDRVVARMERLYRRADETREAVAA